MDIIDKFYNAVKSAEEQFNERLSANSVALGAAFEAYERDNDGAREQFRAVCAQAERELLSAFGALGIGREFGLDGIQVDSRRTASLREVLAKPPTIIPTGEIAAE